MSAKQTEIKLAEWHDLAVSTPYKLGTQRQAKIWSGLLCGYGALVYVYGLAAGNNHGLNLGFAMATVGILPWLAPKRWQEAPPAVFEIGDRQAGAVQWVVNAEFSARDFVYGGDHGVLTVDEGFLVFEGRHTSFALSPNTCFLADSSQGRDLSSPRFSMVDDPRFSVRISSVPVPEQAVGSWSKLDPKLLKNVWEQALSSWSTVEDLAVLPPRIPPSRLSLRQHAIKERRDNAVFCSAAIFCFAIITWQDAGPIITVAMVIALIAYQIRRHLQLNSVLRSEF